MKNEESTREAVQDYYGNTLASSADLKTDACCSIDTIPDHVKSTLCDIHPEVSKKFYGCGSPIPDALEGLTVLDLGCGSGRDCFVISKLVGEKGKVIGVDMTDEQLKVASEHIPWHTEKFGYANPNVEFKKGLIENLAALGIEDNSVDLVVSNCVINLSPNKPEVLSEIFRVLKPGGELYFSDVFALRRVSEELRKDPVLHGECISGALYKEDFRRILGDLGCVDFRFVTERPLEILNPEIEKKLGKAKFVSSTVRAFKLDSLEDRCEDYGQVATYLGTIPEAASAFALDDHHLFETDRPMLVCGNTAAMLEDTRFKKHFKVQGDRSKHFGLFDCEPGAFVSLCDETTEGSCC